MVLQNLTIEHWTFFCNFKYNCSQNCEKYIPKAFGCYITHTQVITLLDESITIRILPNVAKPFLISIIYRPPQSCISWKTSFFEYLELCQVTCNEIILLGDFNVDLLDKKVKSKWNRELSQFSLKQVISAPQELQVLHQP